MNAELEKQNKDRDQELEQLKETLAMSGAKDVSDLPKKILSLEERIKDVRHPRSPCFILLRKVPTHRKPQNV